MSSTLTERRAPSRRVDYTTGGQDPTHVVTWVSKGGGGQLSFVTQEFQDSLTGLVDEREPDPHQLSAIHHGLEGLISALDWVTVPEPPDPMGCREDYE